ncbi:MAG: AmmeMemoRadiSam system radical SAM enzyme [Candidatus Altiarchaeales archaeon]|nr:AmmeMemoRadiSam system radical SAM enzyme [Candidatus Altiarchaeales archaeon]
MEIVREAKASGCKSIAYTYTEPTVFFEYAYDTARLAKQEGLKNVFVTNGFMTEEALREIQPYLDAANVDLKAFTEEFYNKICGAKLEPVKKSLKLMKELGIWVEITTLIIPTLNDSQEELKSMAEFISNELGPETPWHLSKFHPDYKMDSIKATPVETIHTVRELGLEAGLRYVYAGNLPGDSGENTYCYSCNELLINRYLFRINDNQIKDSKCPKCGAEIDGEI